MDTNNMNVDTNQMNGGQFSGAPEMQQQVPPQNEQAPQQIPPQYEQAPGQQAYQAYGQPGAAQPYTGPVTVNNYGYVPQEMTVGRWLLTMLLMCIPIVNIIMLIVWAVSSGPDNHSRKTWAIAQLIWMVIGIVLSIVLMVVFGASIAALGEYMY